MNPAKPRRSRPPAPVLRPEPTGLERDVTANVESYLRTGGWKRGAPGPAGALWRNPHAPAALAVTEQVQLGSVEWYGIVDRLARWAQLTHVEVARRIQHQFVDVTRLRAANDIVIADSIPLAAGASMVTSAAAMLRAAGTTSVRLRGNIAGNFSRFGDDVVAQARMGHTEQGSFIVPILMPLSPSPQPAIEPQIEGMEGLTDSYEPAERRVTRTLAQALAALDAHIIQPAREVKRSDLHGFVEAGGSRELVVAVSRILAEPAVETLETAFAWAGAVDPPAAAPAKVTVPAAAAELLEQSRRLLRDTKLSSAQLLSGPIVEIRMPPGDPFGEISIQTVRAGRPCEVRVRLKAEQVDRAHQWAVAKRAVLVEGAVQSQRGQPLRILTPRRVLPVDETMLGTDD